MQSQREPSFLWMKRMGALWGDFEDQMNPMQMCSSMNSWRTESLDWEREYMGPIGGIAPSSRSILRLYSWWGARVSAFCLLKTSAKSWYSSEILERSGTLSGTEADLPEMEVSERWILKHCTLGNLQAWAKVAALIIEMLGMESRGFGVSEEMDGFCKGSWAV